MNDFKLKTNMLALFASTTQLIIAIAIACAVVLVGIIILCVFLKKKKACAEEKTLPILSQENTDQANVETQQDADETFAEQEQTSTLKQKAAVANGTENTILIDAKKLSGLKIIARYERSFMAKLIQSDEQCKKYYSILKNAFLSYKKVNSRVSWNYDSINYGRVQLAKFSVRGKTLNLYFAIDPETLKDTKYKVENNVSKKYKDVPCQFKITSDRRVKYALELIALVTDTYAVETGKISKENFELPYESTETLVEKGLIRELINKATYDELLKQLSISQAEKINDDKGFSINAKYKKSFMAKLIQSPEQTKQYYSVLKNTLLTYKKVSSRVSWNYDSINYGRVQLAKFSVRGKTLSVYFALDYEKYVDSKYKLENSDSKSFSAVPCQYKISSDRRLKYALELVKDLAEKYALKGGEVKTDNYVLPYESTQVLIDKGLIKELN